MTEQETRLQSAISAGALAFSRGTHVDDCPHGPSDANPETCQSIEHYGWLRGWWQACFDAEKKKEAEADDSSVFYAGLLTDKRRVH